MSEGICCRFRAGFSWPWENDAGATRDRKAATRGRQAEGGVPRHKIGRSLLRDGRDMSFAFVARHRSIWPVRWLCEARNASRSGFHAWLNRAPSKPSRDDEKIGGKVRISFIRSARTFGARRVRRDVLAKGIDCSLHRIERLMRVQALRSRLRRCGIPKGDGQGSTIARTRWMVSSMPSARTSAGSPTSPPFRWRKAGFMRQRSSTCFLAVLSVGP